MPDGGKDCLPYFQRDGKRWKSGAPPEPYPLFGQDTLHEPGAVFACEGEKDTAALHQLGCPAVTSLFGSSAASKSDWDPLSGVATVLLWPDADGPGAKYTDDVAYLLARLPVPPRKVLRIDPIALGLKDGEGAADWIMKRVPSWDGFGPIPREPGDGLLDELMEAVNAHSTPVDMATLRPKVSLVEAEDETLEPFPVDALGELLGGAAKALRDAIKASVEICANSVLGAAALAVQAHADVSIDGRRYPSSLFLITIAESGDRKTAVDAVVLAPVGEWEAEKRRQYHLLATEHKHKAEAYEREKQSILRGKNEAKVKESLIANLGDVPAAPVLMGAIITDPTIEGLQLQLVSWPTAGFFNAEGGGFLGGYSMNTERRLRALACLSDLWGGEALKRARKDGGLVAIANRRLSLHLMVQPSVTADLLADRVASGQGFFARCLIAAPPSLAGTRAYHAVDLTQNSSMQKFHARFRELLNLEPRYREGLPGELDPDVLEVRGPAHTDWCSFYNDVERRCCPGGEYREIKDLAGKAGEHALRLAAVLAVFEGADGIDADIMRRAVALMNWYLHERLRMLGDTGDTATIERADLLMRWAEKRGGTFAKHELQNGGPRSLRKKANNEGVLKHLEETGDLLRVPGKAPIWKIAHRNLKPV